ncbi:hypothetical protein NLX83_13505 [Allokutzneria sp. A3M-2-11 16]|uniref:Rv0909 family putative TA system antitoxin n=1 Tax=Allokutzneria sp. A3M-2-11 16 TaxID=2962043 RepID=UPI0020B74886|nr:Rv0909 family putative TA system antitoxin [Allokutzneria sp. A3M-2-11 16]MCP3800275.1 hypothetical protein [Allokutzneria sp. A3M-2-11 16]
MGFLDKAKELANQAKDKVGPLAEQAKEKAGPLAEKAGGAAARGVDLAASKLDRATRGKYHDKIENVSTRLENVLDPDRRQK